MAQPNSGRIGRSPGAVARISRMLSMISRSPLTSAIEPVASVRSGKAQPGADELVRIVTPPISTVGQPGDDRRAAAGHVAHPGRRQPPMSTVGQPGAIGVGGCTAGGGNEQVCRSPTDGGRQPADQHGGHAGPVSTPGCRWGRPLAPLVASRVSSS